MFCLTSQYHIECMHTSDTNEINVCPIRKTIRLKIKSSGNLPIRQCSFFVHTLVLLGSRTLGWRPIFKVPHPKFVLLHNLRHTQQICAFLQLVELGFWLQSFYKSQIGISNFKKIPHIFSSIKVDGAVSIPCVHNSSKFK